MCRKRAAVLVGAVAILLLSSFGSFRLGRATLSARIDRAEAHQRQLEKVAWVQEFLLGEVFGEASQAAGLLADLADQLGEVPTVPSCVALGWQPPDSTILGDHAGS